MMIDGKQPGGWHPEASRRWRIAVWTISALAVLVLAFEYGYQPTGAAEVTARIAESLIILFFAFNAVLRLWATTNPSRHIRERWYEWGLLALLAVTLVVLASIDVADRGRYLALVLHMALALFLVIRGTELMRGLSESRAQPAQIFVGSFALLIALGTGLLMSPAAASDRLTVRTADGAEQTYRGNLYQRTDAGILFQSGGAAFGGRQNVFIRSDSIVRVENAPRAPWDTALFTATSAVCVTGLIVESTGGYWSPFGQTVILVLIQLGGLGIMTFGAVLAMLLWQNLNFRQSAVMQDVIGPNMAVRVGRILVFILTSTVLIEAVGAWSLWGLWDEFGMSTGQRAFNSVFHAVSAFCNAGFCLYDASLVRYRDTWQANVSFTGLIIMGGLGFTVLYNFTRIARCRLRHAIIRLRGGLPRPDLDRRRLTLQTKLVLLTTVVLLALGLALALLFESLSRDASLMADAPASLRTLYAWFLSVTARTAGFNTVPTGELTDSTKFLTVVLMFIGASPGSTGGGIKTATLAVIAAGIWSLLANKPGGQAFKRQIPPNLLLRALVIMTLGGAVVVTGTLVLSATHNVDFLDALFEATSAFGTVGLSTGLTGALNQAGRLLIIAVMFAGRVGPLMLFFALPLGIRDIEYQYPTETVAVG